MSNKRKCTQLVVLLLLTVSSFTSGSAPLFAQMNNLHPSLAQIAMQSPEQSVAIIIQKDENDTGIADSIVKLGGRVTKDLKIIHAVAATLRAKDVMQLAKVHGVRWISLDAPVSQSEVSDTRVFTTWATQIGTLNQSFSSQANFNNTAIAAKNYLWFTSSISPGRLSAPATFYFGNTTIQFSANGTNYNLKVPDAVVTYSATATAATTTFDRLANRWITVVPLKYTGQVFLTGLRSPVTNNLPASINGVKWSGQMRSDTAGLKVAWRWGAAVYSTTFGADYSSLGVKPVDDNALSQYKNSDLAGTPENFKSILMIGACSSSTTNYTGTCISVSNIYPYRSFTDNYALIDSPSGPNGTYGYAAKAKESFGGFTPQIIPDHVISKIELVLQSYALAPLLSTDNALLTVYLGGNALSTLSLDPHLFDTHVGKSSAGPIYIDITNLRTWHWADFYQGIDLYLDQRPFDQTSFLYHDAIGLRVTSVPGMDTSADVPPSSVPLAPIDSSKLVNVYNQVVRATDIWNESPSYLQGQGIGVAVVDSGIFKVDDWGTRLIHSINFNSAYQSSPDHFGHGTFVAGVIGSDGTSSNGQYMGIAPQSNLINVRVSDDQGMAVESDVINALQWIYEKKDRFNIRVVNLSLNSSLLQSYQTSPLDAACEILWFNGIVVVVSAGNNGSTALYPPANDPFVITVGASDDKGSIILTDDTLATFSAYGTDETGGIKPDLIAPGRNIVSVLPDNSHLLLGQTHPANQVNDLYFRMSGTSVAAPMVSGAVALLLQDEPGMNPDQVKYRLKATANKNWAGYNSTKAGAGILDVYSAVKGTTTMMSNTGVPVSNLLTTGPDGVLGPSVSWSSVSWSSVSWSSVSWSSVSWSSVSWSSVSWSSDYWEDQVQGSDTASNDSAIDQSRPLYLPLVTR